MNCTLTAAKAGTRLLLMGPVYAAAGVALGAGGMYLFDPSRGRRRRHVLRDRLAHLARRLAARTRVKTVDALNHARGAAAEIRGAWQCGEVLDDVLADRVRSSLGHVVRHPGHIEVSARNGVVTVRGSVAAEDFEPALGCAHSVRGVRAVQNALIVPVRVVSVSRDGSAAPPGTAAAA